MGPLEILLILALTLIVFGPDRLPEIARQAGRTVAQVRRITSEATAELNRSLQLEDQPPAVPSRAAIVRPAPPSPSPVAISDPAVGPPSHDDLRPPY
jgi:Tat protein translocase TatB subunit